MIDPKRLSDGSRGVRAAELLSAMRADAPSPDAKSRALAAFGLGSGLVAGSAEAATLAKVSAGAHTAGLVSVTLAKWAGIGAIVGGLSLAGVAYVQDRAPTSPSVGSVASGGSSSERVPEARQPRMPAEGASAAATSSSQAEQSPVSATSLKVSAGPSARTSSYVDPTDTSGGESPVGGASSDPGQTLVQEVRMLDQARAAIAAGDGALALRTLDEYRSVFPRRQMDTESLMLRIKAMVMTGNRAGAQELARAFVKHNPRSPLVQRVRTLAGLAADEKLPAR